MVSRSVYEFFKHYLWTDSPPTPPASEGTLAEMQRGGQGREGRGREGREREGREGREHTWDSIVTDRGSKGLPSLLQPPSRPEAELVARHDGAFLPPYRD
jgi:hypothetical protein